MIYAKAMCWECGIFEHFQEGSVADDSEND